MPARRFHTRPVAIRLACFLGNAVIGIHCSASAQQLGYGQTIGNTSQEQHLYDYGLINQNSNSDSILDSNNPLDLMNKIRRSTALVDATPPSTAIDEALRAFDVQQPIPGPSPAGSALMQKGI